MKLRHSLAVLAVSTFVIGTAIAQRGPTSGPVARYDIRAGTVTGFAAMGAGGGMGAAMGMMFGGGQGKAQHELLLRLGSSRAPTGAPKADHFMPAGAKLGKSVALVTPVEEREVRDQLPGEREGRRPTGRILIFWGCGANAPKGQPVVIDLAKVAAGQMPPGLWSTTVIRDFGPTKANSKTFGRWPAEDGKFARPDSALPGAHRVVGNYSPEIAFTLTKDFMAPLRVSNAEQPGGASLASWNAIPEATGYILTLFGGKRGPGEEMGDVVMWTSSAGRQFGGGLSDWITAAQAAQLVREKTLLAPTATTCMIPAEVRRASPDFRMGMMTAFGPQEDFSYPPRPADPKAAWNLEWTVRVRHRSTTGWMDMPGMPNMGQNDGAQPAKPACKPKIGLGGILGGVIKPGC